MNDRFDHHDALDLGAHRLGGVARLHFLEQRSAWSRRCQAGRRRRRSRRHCPGRDRSPARADAGASPGACAAAGAAALRGHRRQTGERAGHLLTPADVVTAGILSCVSGFGLVFFGGSGVSVGGLATGTVIFSLPGQLELSSEDPAILLPPPPPPPPGPGAFSHTISDGLSSTGARRSAPDRHARDDEEE